MHTAVTLLEEKLFNNTQFVHAAGGTFITMFYYLTVLLFYANAGYRDANKPTKPFQKYVAHSEMPRNQRSSRQQLLLVSLVFVGTSTLTKVSLAYIDVPMQTVLKSAKLLPVMAGSILLHRRVFSAAEWLAALMLASGIALFSLQQSALSEAPPSTGGVVGLSCIVVALVCDALLGNLQQSVLQSGVTVNSLMACQSAFGVLSMLVTCYLSGTLAAGIRLVASDGVLFGELVLWALCLLGGTELILRVVGEYSAVVAVLITSMRKAATLFCSFLFFPKPLGIGHPIGAALVLGSALVKPLLARRRSAKVGVKS